jgi:hypothetical protein
MDGMPYLLKEVAATDGSVYRKPVGTVYYGQDGLLHPLHDHR